MTVGGYRGTKKAIDPLNVGGMYRTAKWEQATLLSRKIPLCGLFEEKSYFLDFPTKLNHACRIL